MASFTYVEAANPNLVCCICRSPFVEPCTTRTCCHTFCYECIAQAIAINRQCPIDRTPLSLHDLLPADPVIRNLVDELIVHCPHRSLGCANTCQRLLLPVHLKDACHYIDVPCPDTRCSRRILKKDVKGHQCSDPSADTPANSNESSQASSQDADSAHKDSTPTSAPSSTPLAGQSSSDLAAENAMLRLRLSALETVVHTLRSEMFAVKHALGPWYRSDVQPELLPEDQPADLAAGEAFERQLAQELAAAPAPSATASDTRPPSAPRDPDDIASYFPSPEETTSQAQSTQSHRRSPPGVVRAHPPSVGQSHGPISPPASSYPSIYPTISPTSVYAPSSFPTASQTPGMPYAQGTSFSATSPATISIPPLDPTTPLPDTLASLHSSLVTLTGGLGALAAARGAESLRTTEELRGLRAAMHGFRMQLHDILTSRSHVASTGAPGTNNGDGDGGEQLSFNLGMTGWLGFGGPRRYGMPLMHHPPHPPAFVGPAIPPTNITKL